MSAPFGLLTISTREGCGIEDIGARDERIVQRINESNIVRKLKRLELNLFAWLSAEKSELIQLLELTKASKKKDKKLKKLNFSSTTFIVL
jgi:hypothetical protein